MQDTELKRPPSIKDIRSYVAQKTEERVEAVQKPIRHKKVINVTVKSVCSIAIAILILIAGIYVYQKYFDTIDSREELADVLNTGTVTEQQRTQTAEALQGTSTVTDQKRLDVGALLLNN